MLEVNGVSSGYGAVQVLNTVSLSVTGASITCVIGPNGAGKSTLARTISGMIRCWEGKIVFDGQDITGLNPEKVVGLGIIQVFERRELFPRLTVLENLLLGCYPKYRQLGKQGRNQALEFVYSLLPRLAERKRQLAGTLSGGEQQMLAIARGLMGQPRLLILDEPSLGLAPFLIETIYELLKKLNANGLTVLLIEEDAYRALNIASYGYVLASGDVVVDGPASELSARAEIELAYLGRRTEKHI